MPTKMKTKVTCAYITEVSYGSVTNISFSAQCKWHFWNENEKKNKNENSFSAENEKKRKW